jgi:hypothetical protein
MPIPRRIPENSFFPCKNVIKATRLKTVGIASNIPHTEEISIVRGFKRNNADPKTLTDSG